MVSKKEVEKQLKGLGFNLSGWGRGEVNELANILLPEEEIFECVNGWYEGGFALLLSTDIRVLLVDKKPLNFLTVEDMRFDMINEIDYSHRVIGAHIGISAGEKNLMFHSINQRRLRNLIGHVQRRMAEIKKKQHEHQEGQNQNLEKINEQLQSYLVAQQEQQQQLYEQLQKAQAGQSGGDLPKLPEPVRPSPELADYLYAQGLLAQHRKETGQSIAATALPPPPLPQPQEPVPDQQLSDLRAAGLQEVFGKQNAGGQTAGSDAQAGQNRPVQQAGGIHLPFNPFDPNPLKIAYSKLPMALRNRKFGRPSFHAHSSSKPAETEPEPAA